jgi:hypothetical protein
MMPNKQRVKDEIEDLYDKMEKIESRIETLEELTQGYLFPLKRIYRRRSYPHHLYAIINYNGELRILNISDNSFWKGGRLKTTDCYAYKHHIGNNTSVEYLTSAEMNAISGDNAVDFIPAMVESADRAYKRLIAQS